MQIIQIFYSITFRWASKLWGTFTRLELHL